MNWIRTHYKQFPPALLVVIGALLILVNGLWIAIRGSAIIIQSYPASSLNETRSTFWWRLSLGLPGYVEGILIAFWLIFAFLLLVAALYLFIKPKKSFSVNVLIIFCSIMSIPIGGGFILGLIMSFIGGLAGMEWPKPIGETFVGKFISALRLDPSLFRTVSKEAGYLRHASRILILVNMCSGLGYGIYYYNVLMMEKSLEMKHAILILGRTFFDISIFYYSIVYIGLAFIKWLIFTLLIYVFGVKLKGSRAEFIGIATAIAYAYIPAALQLFLPSIFATQPTDWAFFLFWVTNIWVMLGLLIAIKECMQISRMDSISLLIISGGLYWIIAYKGIIPYFQVPGVWFTLEPPSFILLLFSIGAVLATLTGAFSRR